MILTSKALMIITIVFGTLTVIQLIFFGERKNVFTVTD